MRVALTFKVDELLILPVSYQHHLQSWLYGMIQDESFADFLHNEGFGESRKFKLFTFSLIKGAYTFHKKDKTLHFKDVFHFDVSSVIEPFIEALLKYLTKRKTFTLNHCKIHLEKYRILTHQIKQPQVDIEMLSPIVAYHTIKDELGKSKTQYYKPSDPEFNALINQNFKRKYKAYTPLDLPEDIFIEPLDVSEKDELIIRYKNHIIIAYKGKYRLKGHPRYLNFLIHTGLGSKNSMGFGMFKVTT